MHNIVAMLRRELGAFFASPVAYIFLGVFLAVSLFVFFWIETFFARNIADLRPLFEWMPVLLIFLVAALTMRSWAEERRSGTLELLMTSPISSLNLVLGKFLAGLILVAIALALTFPLVLTTRLLGPLDWGPVFGAYLASLLLAGAYLAIGLFVSARSDNQIVSLIGTVLLCGVFYLIGTSELTDFLGHQTTELLGLFSSGKRFESITRGVLDLRDLYYYLSLIGIFLSLNVYALEKLRWATDGDGKSSKTWRNLTLLLVFNFLLGNLWLNQIPQARLDLTQGQIYSVSPTTKHQLAELQEPLLLRGYFSAQTHPLLSPLVPQMRDLLREYQIIGGDRVQVEFVDPLENPELEREAGEKYNISPIAFQTANKYQAAVVNSYFNILVQYGDQFEVLTFEDLIEVKLRGLDNVDVRLRNPEYDLTRSIKKVVSSYRAGGDVVADLAKPVKFTGFMSDVSKLPAPLNQLRKDLDGILAKLATSAPENLEIAFRDPQAGDGALAKQIAQDYGFRPQATSVLDPDSFYFYMLLESDGRIVPIPLPESLDKTSLERAIKAALKRFQPGTLRTLALYVPPSQSAFTFRRSEFSDFEDRLEQNANVIKTDLNSGQIPDEADLLLVADPRNLSEKQIFAIDQFVMQGGTAIIAASPYQIELGEAISATQAPTGLEAWLKQQGLTLEKTFVLDAQNTPFPIPSVRYVGGLAIQELRSLPYPFFPDIRPEQFADHKAILSGLGQLTLNWLSPIKIDEEKTQNLTVSRLIRSSEQSWTDDSGQIQPDFQAFPETGFSQPDDETHAQWLAVMLEGRMPSFFAGKPSPLLRNVNSANPATESGENNAAEPNQTTVVSSVIERSPNSARIVLISSGSFLRNAVLGLAQDATGTRYDQPLQMMQNLIDWSLEDRDLLKLRGRGQFSRTLLPLDRNDQLLWEYFNYAMALLGLLFVFLTRRKIVQQRQLQSQTLLGQEVRK